MVKKTHQVRRTLLIVGEGDSEEAFLKHVRELICSGGAGVAATIRNAHGKGPEHVIAHTVRQAVIYSYDRRVAFLDTDIPWTDKLQKNARKWKIDMVGSSPCLEGLLLAVLGHRVPEQSSDCKRLIQQTIRLDLTERKSYAVHFSLPVLVTARQTIPELHRLLQFFEGRWP